jgi:hypothetical protein
MRRSADGSGDLNGAIGYGASFLVLKGALCVSLMTRTLVRTVEAMMDAAKEELAALQQLRRVLRARVWRSGSNNDKCSASMLSQVSRNLTSVL